MRVWGGGEHRKPPTTKRRGAAREGEGEIVVSAWIVALVLSTAFFHAGWNAVLRHSSDRLFTTAMIAFGGAMVAASFLPFLPWPGRASVPFMLASFVLHTVYRVLLIFAYRCGDLATVLPPPPAPPPLPPTPPPPPS